MSYLWNKTLKLQHASPKHFIQPPPSPQHSATLRIPSSLSLLIIATLLTPASLVTSTVLAVYTRHQSRNHQIIT